MNHTEEAQLVPIENMPQNSRVWVFQASKELNYDEIEFMRVNLQLFLPSWAAHGNQLYANYKILENRILLIFLDEEQAGASGCSIDKLMGIITAFEDKLSIDLRDRNLVLYKEGAELKESKLNDLKGLVDSAAINENTLFINPLVSTKKAFENEFEQRLGDSWHSKFI